MSRARLVITSSTAGPVYAADPAMTERHRELRRYVRFTEEDSARVIACADDVDPHLQHVSDVFYERIREHEEAHAVLRDEEQIGRLRASLVRWMRGTFRGPHDDAHFARTEHIGHVHVQVGLPARYMVTAMAVVRCALLDVLTRVDRGAALDSVTRLLDVELAVMLDAYWEHYAKRTSDLSRVARLAAGQAHVDETAFTLEDLGVIVLGLDGRDRVVLFNDEAERATGYSADEILGRPVTELFVREDTELVEGRLAVARAGGVPSSFDSGVLTKVGRVRDVRGRFKHAQAGARGLRTFFTGTDVTEELALERRTRQAERLASIGRLAAGLAHEIRNPLNGAHLHLTLLERVLRKRGASDGDDALEAVHTVAHEVQRLSNLVTEFLQFARPQPLTLVPTPLAEVCAHVSRLLGPEAARQGITLALDLPVSDVRVRADADKLSQVLMNLVRNAIDALALDAQAANGERPDGAPPAPAGRVVLRLRRQPRAAFIEVEDDGPGIPDGDAPIFDAFYSTKASGTGLGLPIAHRIVQDHGGQLTYESRDVDPSDASDAGARRARPRVTVFRVKLPVIEGFGPSVPEERG